MTKASDMLPMIKQIHASCVESLASLSKPSIPSTYEGGMARAQEDDSLSNAVTVWLRLSEHKLDEVSAWQLRQAQVTEQRHRHVQTWSESNQLCQRACCSAQETHYF